MAMDPRQENNDVSINMIVETLIRRLAAHPLIVKPPIVDANGAPLRITKYRNFDGPEVKQFSAITCSVFPYYYGKGTGVSNLTTDSKNVGVRYEPYSLEGIDAYTDQTALDKTIATIAVKISIGGFASPSEVDPKASPGQRVTFETSPFEMLLRMYMELIRRVLTGRAMRLLPRYPDGKRLLANAFVEHIDYPSARWDSEASVLHHATLIWRVTYYSPRQWLKPESYELVPEDTSGRLEVGSALGFDIVYDIDTGKYYETTNDTVIDRSDLVDSNTDELYNTLDSGIIELIDTAPELFDPSTSGVFRSWYLKVDLPRWEC